MNVSDEVLLAIKKNTSINISHDVTVKQKLSLESTIIVRLDHGKSISRGDQTLDRNVYMIDEDGEVVWQIEACPVDESPKPYMNIEMVDGELKAGNWVGVDLIVDIKSGLVAPDPKKMGRPW